MEYQYPPGALVCAQVAPELLEVQIPLVEESWFWLLNPEIDD